MSNETVLVSFLSAGNTYFTDTKRQITGVSGFVGFAVLWEALNSGYKVKAVVRKNADIVKVKNGFENTKPELLSKLEFVVIPDLTAVNAYTSSIMDGVDHVIHVASVVPHPVCFSGIVLLI